MSVIIFFSAQAVTFNETFSCVFTILEFTVKVIAEDDSLLNTTTASHISMKVWKSDSAKQNTPPAMVSFTSDSHITINCTL